MTNRRMDGPTDGRTDGWTDRRMDGRTDGLTDGPTTRLLELLRAAKNLFIHIYAYLFFVCFYHDLS